MSWLTPLGFLGLIGLIVLIIIYIIKPNYQNKIISSTFVWKLSLKYRKKRIPLNKLNSILLFLCQMLIITSAALILAQPFIASDKVESNRKVMIIDASISMQAKTGGSTRFEKAVDEVRAEVDKLFSGADNENAEVSIILASDTPSFLVQSAGAASETQVMDALASLTDPANKNAVNYGKSDIPAAIKLAEEITAYSENVEVMLFTDVDYIDPGQVTVRSVKDINDWNAAILDVRAINEENSYRIEIDVACYGKNRAIRVMCDVAGVNEASETLNLVADVNCDGDEVQTIAFGTMPEDAIGAELVEDVDIYSFDHVYVRIEESDSFDMDNSFYLYGGKKQPLRIQYASKTPNNYFGSALMVLRNQLSYRWDVEIEEVDPETDPALEGFDLYVFEHKMPPVLPTDGVVFLVNPDEIPKDAGFRLGSVKGFHEEHALTAGESSPITSSVTAELITVTRYLPLTSFDGFTPLLYCDGDPVFIAKNDPDQKLAVMSFSLNYSNLAVMMEFPLMMYNMMEYYTPSTVTTHIFEVGDSVSLGARSEDLFVTGPNLNTTFTEFPANLSLTTPGVYTVTQTPLSGNEIVENFYVRIPKEESNIVAVEDAVEQPTYFVAQENTNLDLLLYLAIALVALLFAEWLLHSREQY